MPLMRKAVIFSFCHVGRSSRSATAIFVSNTIRSAAMSPLASLHHARVSNVLSVAATERTFLYDLALPRVLPRRHTDHALEAACEVALIRESGRVGDLDKRQPARQEALRLPDAHALQVGVQWQTDCRAEDTREIERAEPDQLREADQRHVLVIVGSDIFADAADGRALVADPSLRVVDRRVTRDQVGEGFNQSRLALKRRDGLDERAMQRDEPAGERGVNDDRRGKYGVA